MNIGYLRLDNYGLSNITEYNVQEIGLAKAFEHLGHTTYIFFWLDKNDPRCHTKDALTDHIYKVYLPYRFKIGHHVFIDMDLLLPFQLDLIHIQTDNLLFVPNAVDYCLRKGINYYCYVGTIKSSNRRFWVKALLDRITIRNIRAFRKSLVFCKTPAVAQELRQKNVNNVEVAPVGLDISVIPTTFESPEKLRQTYHIPADRKIIVSVCGLRHDKRPFDLFQLAEMLDDSFCLIHIGTGLLEKEFQAKLKEKDCYRKIIHIERIPNTCIHSFYKIADYSVNFNPGEIFGMAILEAMYHDCTVIAIDAPGPNYIIENGDSGFIVNSIEEMADIIQRGMKIKNAHRRIMELFTWEKTAKKFLSYFSEL